MHYARIITKLRGVLQDCYVLQKIKTRKIIHALKQKKWSEKMIFLMENIKRLGIMIAVVNFRADIERK